MVVVNTKRGDIFAIPDYDVNLYSEIVTLASSPSNRNKLVSISTMDKLYKIDSLGRIRESEYSLNLTNTFQDQLDDIDTTITNLSLDDLSDVFVPSPPDGYVLKWVASNSRWEAQPDLQGSPGSGTGDMLQSVYDTNNNGVVDNSERLGTFLPGYYLNRANHTGTQLASTISNFNAAAQSAAVQDVLNDGVTNIAPSQNRVYDEFQIVYQQLSLAIYQSLAY